MADYSNYTNKEMQAVTIAKQIQNGQVVIVGTGLPLIGASVAKRVFAPQCNIIVESGLMDCCPIEVPHSVGDCRFMLYILRIKQLASQLTVMVNYCAKQLKILATIPIFVVTRVLALLMQQVKELLKSWILLPVRM